MNSPLPDPTAWLTDLFKTQNPMVLWPVGDVADTSAAVAAALRARGIPCDLAPSAAKFGKQIRYAERRGIPFVWFVGAGAEGGDEVKDIRSGLQVAADAATWLCPEADLRPAMLLGV